MKPERWQQIDLLLQEALAREPDERPAFLTLACGSDETLRQEVESLLVSHDQAGNLLDTPLPQIAAEVLVKGRVQCVEGQTIGHFKVLAELGAGAMGEVYLAEDARLGRKVALKILPAEFTRDLRRLHRFEQEARAASALNHPNILTIHEIGQADDLHFIATEFIDGQTLRQRMSGARLKLGETLDIAAQFAAALAAAHEAGIVHRDIKPENVMLRRDGYIKILDFGLAKLTERQAPSNSDSPDRAAFETDPGTVMGTAHYMSPEQARGLEVDARTDVFSLGVVFYEMIAGRTPFDGATASDVITAILKEEPIPIAHQSAEVPAEVDWIVKKALAKDRDERYQTIRELYIDLKRLRQELELLAKMDGMSPAGLGQGAPRTKSGGLAIGDLTNKNRLEALAGPPQVRSTNQKRNTVSLFRAIVPAVAAITIISLLAFYAGLKWAPLSVTPTFSQLTFRRGVVSTARFAQDGEIIYSAAFDGEPLELFMLRPGSPQSSLFRLQGSPRVTEIQSISSTGELAVLLDCELDSGKCLDGTLALARPGADTPKEIESHVYGADWAPNARDLAIVRVVEAEYQLEYPIERVLYKSHGRLDHVRVSPNGDAVAFTDEQSVGLGSKSLMIVDHKGNKTTLSAGWRGINGLAWSPTGKEVWFSASRGQLMALYAATLSGAERLIFEGMGNLGLHDISRDGQVLLHRGLPLARMMSGLTARSETERNLSWFDYSISADISADGRNVLFYEHGVGVGHAFFAFLRTTDRLNEPLRLGQGRALALSPDQKWALTLQEDSAQQLVLLPTSPGKPSLLPRGDIKEYHYASWFPDGKRILFTGRTDSGHGLRSYIQETSGSQPQPITQEGVVALSASPDGNRFFAWVPDPRLGGDYRLLSLNQTESTEATPIKGLGLGEVPIQWSSDARSLYVRSSSDSDARIYRLDLSSGRRELLKAIVADPVGFLGFEVNPGGIQITPDGKSYVYTYWTVLRELFLAKGLK